MKIGTLLLLSGLALVPFAANAQWKDVQFIGTGGESTVATDGLGSVYITAHLPCVLYGSSDWGAHVSALQNFPDSLGDMFVLGRQGGKLNVVYTRKQLNGIGTWFSDDHGKTIKQGENFPGPLDREWLVENPAGKGLLLDYTNGYIGGPKSKGVFLARSLNEGMSFEQITRIDQEPPGSYGVDPYLTTSTKGRLYAMWQVSTDYNTIDSFKFAYSDDGGVTFSEPKVVAEFPKQVGGEKVDTQERWILGSILGVGEKTVVITYPGYEQVTINGEPYTAFVEHYKVSFDGGVTFSKGRTMLSGHELATAVKEFKANKQAEENFPYYIQVLPWLCKDPKGGVHFVFTDNRLGQGEINGKQYGRWQVRHTESLDLASGFGESEQVSGAYTCLRPPMDFVSCAADSKFLYVTWTETPNSISDFQFTGRLNLGRKPLK